MALEDGVAVGNGFVVPAPNRRLCCQVSASAVPVKGNTGRRGRSLIRNKLPCLPRTEVAKAFKPLLVVAHSAGVEEVGLQHLLLPSPRGPQGLETILKILLGEVCDHPHQLLQQWQPSEAEVTTVRPSAHKPAIGKGDAPVPLPWWIDFL